MKKPRFFSFLTAVLGGFVLMLLPDFCWAQTFTLNLPNRADPKLPIGRIKITLEVSGAPNIGGDQLTVPGGTKILTATPIPNTIGGNRVLFYKGTGNTEVIDIELRSLLTSSLCVANVSAFPTTLSLTVTFSTAASITGYHLNSYSALSSNQCTCLRRRLDNLGATWLTPPPGVDRGRHALDVVLVLDRSGSMSEPVPSGLPGSTSEIKMTVLKTAVKEFIDLWRLEATGQPDDRVAIVWFETGVITTPPGFVRRDTAGGWDGLKGAVDLQITANRTAMGDGFSQAVDMWEDNPMNDASIVILTNGMQNEGNQIKPDAVDPALWAYNHLNAPVGYTSIAGACIPVQTIGVGAPADIQANLLNQVSEQSGGESNIVVNATGMANSFGNHLVSILKGNTMSIAKREDGTLGSGSSSVSPSTVFRLDTTVRQAIILLGWTGAGNQNALKLELIRPGGGAAVAPVLKQDDPFYTVQTLDLPASGPAGDWQARIVRNAGSGAVPFYISIYTVESTFNAQLAFHKIDYGTGDDIILTAVLTFNGQPLLNQGNGLQVRVERPQSALSTALHNLNVSASVLTTPPPGVSADSYTKPYERKLFNLLQTTSLGQDIEPKPDPGTLTLLDNGNPANGDAVAGDGIYSVRYSQTQIPGRYRFRIAMNMAIPSGSVNRIEQHDTEVNVIAIDTKQSEVNATNLLVGNYRLDIVPADRFGNFLGPGYADQIKVTLIGGGTVSGPLVDERQNGTYTAQLTGISNATATHVKVSFRGKEFWDTSVRDTQRPKRHYAVFASIGRNFPQGDFNSGFDSGVSAQFGFEYLFINRLSVEASFGYDRFPFKIPSDHLSLFRGSANLKFYPVIGTFQFGIFGGGGVYNFDPGDTRGGMNIGAVAEYRVTTSIGVEATYNFHNVFTPGSSVQYSNVQGGLRFRF